jgi:hypothetical protein
MRVWFGGRGSTKSIALGSSTCLGVTALLLLDLSKQQEQSTLHEPFGLSQFDLLACLGC